MRDDTGAFGAGSTSRAKGWVASEAVQKLHGLPVEAMLDMGDFVGGFLKYVRRHPVPRLTIGGGFAKVSKLADGHLDLHSARSQVDLDQLAERTAGVRRECGSAVPDPGRGHGGGSARPRRARRGAARPGRRRRGAGCGARGGAREGGDRSRYRQSFRANLRALACLSDCLCSEGSARLSSPPARLRARCGVERRADGVRTGSRDLAPCNEPFNPKKIVVRTRKMPGPCEPYLS